MKEKVLLLALFAVAVSACFGESGGSYSYTLQANFEYASGAYEDFGKDSVYFEGWPGWEHLGFCNKVDSLPDKTIEFKGGFAVSYLQGPDSLKLETPSENPFRVCGSSEPNTYLVWRQTDDMPEHDMFFISSQLGTCIMRGCYVNNSENVRQAIESEGGFVPGDRLELIATGYTEDGKKTGSASFVLADCSAVKDSIVTSWTPFDLSKLSAIKYVDFELKSNREDLDLDSFCLDYITANIALEYK